MLETVRLTLKGIVLFVILAALLAVAWPLAFAMWLFGDEDDLGHAALVIVVGFGGVVGWLYAVSEVGPWKP